MTQLLVELAVKVEGVQANEDTPTVETGECTVPPLALIGKLKPPDVAPMAPEMGSALDVLDVFERVTLTVTTTPLPIVVVLVAQIKQVVFPLVG